MRHFSIDNLSADAIDVVLELRRVGGELNTCSRFSLSHQLVALGWRLIPISPEKFLTLMAPPASLNVGLLWKLVRHREEIFDAIEKTGSTR